MFRIDDNLCIDSPDPMGNVMFLTLGGTEFVDDFLKPFFAFYVYRVVSAFIYLILVTIFATVSSIEAEEVEEYETRNANTMKNQFGLFMFIYCWICSCVWPFIGLTVLSGGADSGSNTRELAGLQIFYDVMTTKLTKILK